MIQIRPHGGTIEESMREVYFVNEADDVLAYLMCKRPDLRVRSVDELAQRHFGRDERTARYDAERRVWNAWTISVRDTTTLWANGPVPNIPVRPPLEEDRLDYHAD